MKIQVNVKTNAKQQKVEKLSENEYKVWVKEPAKENKANYAVIDIISELFSVSKSSIQIVSGLKSKTKIIKL